MTIAVEHLLDVVLLFNLFQCIHNPFFQARGIKRADFLVPLVRCQNYHIASTDVKEELTTLLLDSMMWEQSNTN